MIQKEGSQPMLNYGEQLFFHFFWLEMIIYPTPYMNGRATTLGVFKAYVVFFAFVLHLDTAIITNSMTWFPVKRTHHK